MGLLLRCIAPCLAALLSACAALPDVPDPPAHEWPSTQADTQLARALSGRLAEHPGLSGIVALSNPLDSFAARMVLARTAERTIEAQYYIWRGDITGKLLLEALYEAAERGVHVRLLIDDAGSHGIDEMLAVVEAHPNMEVRLFNPFANRGFRWFEAFFQFARINRRMHNKSFTVDGQATIVGGRNIADEYFGTGESALFTDLDVLAVGPAADEAVKQFAGYWRAASAYPVKQLIAPAGPRTVAEVRQDWAQSRASPAADEYLQAVRRTPLVTRLLAGGLEFEWAPARVLYDDPAKIREPPEKLDTHLLSRLQEALGRPRQELDLVSPYFVPGTQVVEAFQSLLAGGVRIRVLTNSLASSDFAPVHAGYARYREDLLRSGVELFEMKPRGAEVEADHVSLGSSSPSALHAKTFAVDRQRIFVGSFNLDPRSARLNTEMGLVIDSARLSSRLASVLDGPVRELAWQPRLDANGRVRWIDRSSDGERVLSTEPESSWLRRVWLSILSVLPIESLL